MEGKRPKARAQGKHLRNSCGSESRKGERKPSARPSTGTWKEDMRNQVREKGETEEARAETGTGKAAVRQNREEKERKNRKLSSWKRKGSGRKKAERKWKSKEVERQRGSTCGTAVGAKQGRAKRNEQRSQVQESGRKA